MCNKGEAARVRDCLRGRAPRAVARHAWMCVLSRHLWGSEHRRGTGACGLPRRAAHRGRVPAVPVALCCTRMHPQAPTCSLPSSQLQRVTTTTTTIISNAYASPHAPRPHVLPRCVASLPPNETRALPTPTLTRRHPFTAYIFTRALGSEPRSRTTMLVA